MKLQTKWDLSKFYTSFTDPKIETDLKTFESEALKFSKIWKSKENNLRDPKLLLAALNDYEKIQESSTGLRPILYFHYSLALNSMDPMVHGFLAKCTERLTKAENNLVFFQLAIGKIPSIDQNIILKDKKLSRYSYYLERSFLSAKHHLSEKEEQISNLMSSPSYSLWVNGVDKALNAKTVRLNNKDLPLPEAQNLVPRLKTATRRKLHSEIMKKAAEVSEFAESELNAIITRKKIEDELRHYKKPYSARVLVAENEEKTVERLLSVVQEYFSLSHRFYAVKAKLLKLPTLTYADRAAQVGTISRIYSFEESYKIIYDAFYDLHPDFANILERLVTQGQVDVYPKKGKQGGAFCSHGTGTPTVVLLNHVNTFESVTTFAHEMGHAIHSELSKSQPVFYQDYSLSTAETASTFFERVVFERLVKDFTKKEKIIALHDKLSDDINTIFRQIAVFQFELELHTKIREKGFVPKEEIGSLLNTHMQSYLGKTVKLISEDGYFFVLWPHLRSFFYVYTYAFGQLVSKALYAKVKENPEYTERVREFLEAGGSQTPEHIFKTIGIDVKEPSFFKIGLQTIEEDIKTLESMVKSH